MSLAGKHIIAIVVLCMACAPISSQKDSLLSVLENEENVANKIAIAGKLYWEYLYKDIDFSDSMTTLAIELTDNEANDSLRCVALHMKATVMMVRAEYDSSLQYVQIIHRIADKNSFLDRKAACYSLEGLLHYYKGDFNESIEKHFAALNIRRDLGDLSGQTKTLSNIGISYERLREDKKAIDFYFQALEITEESDDYGLASLWSNIGAIQINNGDILAAKTSLLKSKSHLKPEFHISLINDVDHGLAKIYKELGELEKAMALAKQIQKRAIASQDYFRQVRIFELLASILMEQSDYHAAINQYEKAIALYSQKELGESSLDTYRNLKRAYQATGKNTLALIASDSVLSITKALYNKEKLAVTEDLNLKYQTAVNEKKLQEARQLSITNTYQRNIAITVLLLLLSIGAFFWQRIKSKELVQQKKDILHKKELQILKKKKRFSV